MENPFLIQPPDTGFTRTALDPVNIHALNSIQPLRKSDPGDHRQLSCLVKPAYLFRLYFCPVLPKTRCNTMAQSVQMREMVTLPASPGLRLNAVSAAAAAKTARVPLGPSAEPCPPVSIRLCLKCCILKQKSSSCANRP